MVELTWEDLDFNKIESMTFSCRHCKRINVKIPCESLRCDFCGNDLLEIENTTGGSS